MKIERLKICLRREIGLEALRRFADNNPREYEYLLGLTNDDEALSMLSLTLFHPEREKEIFQQMGRYKPHVKNPNFLQGELVRILRPIATAVKRESVEEQIQTWKGRIPEIQMRLEKIIDYFRPAVMPTRVIIVPSDTIVTESSGMSFVVGNEVLISSHTTNMHNLIHEFLHCIINPIVYGRIAKLLSGAQMRQIMTMAGDWLEDYGEYPLSLFAEALIRVYNDGVEWGKKPQYSDQLRNRVFQLYCEYGLMRQKSSVSFQAFLHTHISDLYESFA